MKYLIAIFCLVIMGLLGFIGLILNDVKHGYEFSPAPFVETPDPQGDIIAPRILKKRVEKAPPTVNQVTAPASKPDPTIEEKKELIRYELELKKAEAEEQRQQAMRDRAIAKIQAEIDVYQGRVDDLKANYARDNHPHVKAYRAKIELLRKRVARYEH